MKTVIIIYIVFAVMHGIWAITRQFKYHPNYVEWWRLFIVFIINSVGGYVPEAGRTSGNIALTIDWLNDHIKENDAHEWESEILDME